MRHCMGDFKPRVAFKRILQIRVQDEYAAKYQDFGNFKFSPSQDVVKIIYGVPTIFCLLTQTVATDFDSKVLAVFLLVPLEECSYCILFLKLIRLSRKVKLSGKLLLNICSFALASGGGGVCDCIQEIEAQFSAVQFLTSAV